MKSWKCVAIVGVGLIGGSVGLALRSRRSATRVVGFGSRPSSLEIARKIGAISEIAADFKSAVAQADLVVVCAPVAHVVELVRQAAALCRAATLITDVGSTKAEIVAELEIAAAEPDWGGKIHFLGSHPLAGNERKGAQHASADLFAGRTVVITPTPRTRDEDRSALTEFWESLGAKVVAMPADEHDQALAATSHLPHLVAAAIAGATPERYVTLTASGWQDTTRIAAGDPVLWRQIMVANRTYLLASVDRFATLLAQWRAALEAGDAVEMERLLTEAKRIRDAVGS